MEALSDRLHAHARSGEGVTRTERNGGVPGPPLGITIASDQCHGRGRSSARPYWYPEVKEPEKQVIVVFKTREIGRGPQFKYRENFVTEYRVEPEPDHGFRLAEGVAVLAITASAISAEYGSGMNYVSVQ